MAIRFYKLFDILNRRGMKKGDLKDLIGLSSTTVTKLSKGENVETSTIDRICKGLDVQPADIMEYIPDSD